jgi:hypothetical protein
MTVIMLASSHIKFAFHNFLHHCREPT